MYTVLPSRWYVNTAIATGIPVRKIMTKEHFHVIFLKKIFSEQVSELSPADGMTTSIWWQNLKTLERSLFWTVTLLLCCPFVICSVHMACPSSLPISNCHLNTFNLHLLLIHDTHFTKEENLQMPTKTIRTFEGRPVTSDESQITVH